MTGRPATARRFLLTGVVSHYQRDASWDRPELAADLKEITDLFGELLGYEHVPVMGLDPGWLQMQDALRDFCTSEDRRPDDYVVVYLAGHGEVLAAGDTEAEHVLLPADAMPADLRRRVIKSADMAEWLLADTRVRRLLIMIDTCFSGQGGIGFLRRAAWAGVTDRFDRPDGSGVVVVSATKPRQQAVPGAFAAAFARAVRNRATAGHAADSIAIDAVIRAVNADPALPPTQRAQWSLVLGDGEIPAFLPNPRRDPTLVDLDLADQARRWQQRREQEHRRAEEMRGQFASRAAGFIGRNQALNDLSRWLEDTADTRPRVVIGDPGSGKTAVLGLLASLSDPQRRPTVPRDGLPPGIVSRTGLIDAAVYAGNLASSQVLGALAAAAGIADPEPDPDAFDAGVARLLTGVRERPVPLTVMIDALDEAIDPAYLAGRLLRPLVEHGRDGIRLLLGARRHVCTHLGPAWQQLCEVIDLDEPRYADPQALAALTRRILRDGGSTAAAPVPGSPQGVLEAITAVIAEAAGKSFFVAKILATTQASQSWLPDPADPLWRASLPRTVGQAMHRDLAARLGDDTERAISLLRPLAYGQGAGLPWEDIWAKLAAAISAGDRWTTEDLLWLSERAGSYITESGTIAGRSLYRLYHQSLADYLTAGRDQAADHRAITEALVSHVPIRINGRPDWAGAHPYIRAHLSSHAAAGGLIDLLAADPGFLLAVDPVALLAALEDTASLPARAAADAYRRARPFLGRNPEAEHPAYLSLAARCGRAEFLADQVTADGLDHRSTWRPRWASWQFLRSHQEVHGHTGWVRAVATAELDDRPVVISASSDGTVRIWDLATGALIGDPLTGHGGAVNAVATAELDDRPVVISGSNDGTVRIWDLATGALIGDPFTGPDGVVRAVAAARLGGRPVVISGCGDGTVRVWDLATGIPVSDPVAGHGAAVNAVAAAVLDGRPVVISGSDDGTVRVWDLATAAPAGGPLGGHDGAVLAVTTAQLADRTVVISGSNDRTVRVWDLATGTPIGDPLTGHSSAVRAVATARLDGRPVIVSASNDETVRVWDLATGTPIGTPLTGHADWVRTVATAELNGRPVVVSGGDDETVRIWDLADRPAAGDPFTGHSGPVKAVALAELRRRQVIVSGSEDGTVRVWDLATGTPIGDPFTGHGGPVNAVATAKLDGRPVVVTGSSDGTVRVWDLATGTPALDPLTGHDGQVYAVVVTTLHGRPVVVSGSGDGTVRVWDLATGTSAADVLFRQDEAVYAVAAAELDGRPVVVTGSSDGTVRVWDLATGTPVGTAPVTHGGAVYAVAAAELDGRPVVVTGSSDGTVRVWDLAAGTPVGGPLTGHAKWVRAVATTVLDGRPVVISGSDDGTVRVWDLATGTPVGNPFTGHGGWVFTVAAAVHDGRPVVISGSDDETVRVWDLATGTPAGDPFTGHRGPVNAVAAAVLDGRPVVISGSDDGTVRVWDLATGSPVGDPFTGHGGAVNAVAAAVLDGRPVVISGSDETVRVWDLATGTPAGDPLTSRSGRVAAVACPPAGVLAGRGAPASSIPVVIGAGDTAGLTIFSPAVSGPAWTPVMTPQLESRVIATAWHLPRALIVAAERGIVVIEMT